MKKKIDSFYIVSALTHYSSSNLGERHQYKTEKQAVDRAKEVIAMRAKEGQKSMQFFVLKAVAIVSPVAPPTKVTKLGR